MLLYHGSNAAIERPDVSRNTGFADLGQSFYLTDDHDVARRRAASRARRAGGEPVVSAFELDESCVPWAMWGVGQPTLPDSADGTPLACASSQARQASSPGLTTSRPAAPDAPRCLA